MGAQVLCSDLDNTDVLPVGTLNSDRHRPPLVVHSIETLCGCERGRGFAATRAAGEPFRLRCRYRIAPPQLARAGRSGTDDHLGRVFGRYPGRRRAGNPRAGQRQQQRPPWHSAYLAWSFWWYGVRPVRVGDERAGRRWRQSRVPRSQNLSESLVEQVRVGQHYSPELAVQYRDGGDSFHGRGYTATRGRSSAVVEMTWRSAVSPIAS